MTTEKTYGFICRDCGTEYSVTTSEAAANGWTSIVAVRHLDCTATPRIRTPYDPYDVSKWTAREVREMQAQIDGTEED